MLLYEIMKRHEEGLRLEGKSSGARNGVGNAARFLVRNGMPLDTPARSLTLQRLAGVYAEAAKSGVKPQSVDTHLRVLRAAYNRGVRYGYLDGEKLQLPKIRIPKTVKRALEPGEVRALLRQASRHGSPLLHLTLALGVYCGLRKQEIAHLRRENISDLAAAEGSPYLMVKAVEQTTPYFYKWAPKGNRERIVPVPRPLATLLLQMLGGAPNKTGWVFPGAGYTPRTNLDRGVADAFGRAGIRGEASLHVLRRTYATRLATKGAPVAVISQMMGHGSTEITQRYICSSTPAQFAAAELLDYNEEERSDGE